MKLYHQKLGEGPLLLILHGLFGSSDNWMTIARKLSASYKVLVVDIRNHGKSPHDDDFSYKVMVADIKELLADEGIHSIILIGHSMGGKIAMQFAIQYPMAVKKLVVIDIGPKAYPLHHKKILEGLMSINLQKINTRNQADKALSAYVPEAGVRQFLLKNLKRVDTGFEWKMNLEVINKKIANVGTGLKSSDVSYVQALFIAGGQSDYILPEDTSSILHHFPNAQQASISNASHWVHAEQPKQFVTLVDSFL